MRIALLNSYDMRGGAARAVRRLHHALRGIGEDSRLVVQSRTGSDPDVIGPSGPVGRARAYLRTALDLAPIAPYWTRKQGVFYPGWLPGGVLPKVARLRPDVVHMHWISGGLLRLDALPGLGRPVAWTLHDMWAFTGGCHYDDGCGRYQDGCGRCPVLGSRRSRDPSRSGWARKERAYRNASLTLVSPSRWLGDLAARSMLAGRFPVHVIPNGIDSRSFRPMGRAQARAKAGLPADTGVILFGAANAAADPRKGMGYLADALRRFAAAWRGRPLVAVIFGASPPREAPDLGMPVVFPGILRSDEALAQLYSSADVFVAPSLQENLSNTVMEALACGTPCVAFDVGGMRDMIEHQVNGYLVPERDAAGLAQGLQWILEDADRARILSARARAKVLEEFDGAGIAARHVELYRSMLERHAASSAGKRP